MGLSQSQRRTTQQGLPRAFPAEPYAPSLLRPLLRPWSLHRWWHWWWPPSCWAPRWLQGLASCARSQVPTSAHRDLCQALSLFSCVGTGGPGDPSRWGLTYIPTSASATQQPPGGAPVPGQRAATPTALQPTSPFQRLHLPARSLEPRLAAPSPEGPSEASKCVCV